MLALFGSPAEAQVHHGDRALARISEASDSGGASIQIVASPTALNGPDLAAGLEALLAEEATGLRRCASPLEGREVWSCESLSPDRERWMGLARRFAAAGGELRLAAGPDELREALDDVRFESQGRGAARVLARAVQRTFDPAPSEVSA